MFILYQIFKDEKQAKEALNKLLENLGQQTYATPVMCNYHYNNGIKIIRGNPFFNKTGSNND